MKRRIPSFLLALLLLVSLFPTAAGAALNFNRGTPTVLVTLEGLGQETCFATLLAQETESGPWVQADTFADAPQTEGTNQAVWEAFNGYEDPDGFHFLGYFQNVTQVQSFLWNYCPPQTFKLLLYYPDSGTFCLSGETCQREAYNSYFTASLSGDQLSLTQASTTGPLVFSLVLRTLVMAAAALVIALLFRIRGKQLPFYLGIHTGILLVLNLFLALVNYRSGSSLFLMDALLLTIVVVMAEWKLFGKSLPKRAADPEAPCPVRKFTLIANLVGMILNVALALFLPVMG